MKRFSVSLLLICMAVLFFPLTGYAGGNVIASLPDDAGGQGALLFLQQLESMPDRQNDSPIALAEMQHHAVAAFGSSHGQMRIHTAVVSGRHHALCLYCPERPKTYHSRSSFYAIAGNPFSSDTSPPMQVV